ncbi:MAG: hypothetical protein DRP61_04240 [Candidatus Omnitrophota bacterium]|nr:MAG: hypothetical protein DRP61_04240 [Candidatus Omnitrophota bacterium]
MNFKKHLLIIIIYSLVTAGFTWPLILNLNKATPSIIPFYPQYKNMTDEYSEIWVTWQLKKTVEKKENFFLVKEIFYPLGANFVLADHTLVQSLLVSPVLFLLKNPVVAYNLIILLSCLLTSYASFLLIYYLTKNKEASFLGGLIVSFSSIRIAHILAAHIGIFSWEWAILFILYFLKIFKEGKPTYFLIGAFFFFLNTLTSYYLSVFLTIFIFLWLLTQPKIENFFKIVKLVGIITIFHLPLFFLILKAINQGYFPQEKYVFKMSYFYGADLLGFFVPPFFHSLFKNLVEGFYKNLSGNAWEHTTYIGYTVLFLALFSLFKFKKNREVKKFAIMAFIFLILSLGAVLWIGGRPVVVKNNLLYLPQYLFKFIPIFNNVRLPSRFTIMGVIFLTILSCYTLKYFFENSKRKKMIFTIILSSVFLENLTIPLPLNKELNIPPIYTKIAKENEDFTILEVPFCLASGVKALGSYWTSFQFYQTIHKKNILGGNLGRIPEFVYKYYQKIPLTSSLIKLQKKKSLSLQEIEKDKKNIAKTLAFLNLRYVIIHTNLIKNSLIYKYLKEVLTPYTEEKTKEEKLLVWKLKKIDKKLLNSLDFSEEYSWLYVVRGFDKFALKKAVLWSIHKKSSLLIPLDKKDTYTLKFSFYSLKPSKIEIFINQRKKAKINLSKGITYQEIKIRKEEVKGKINYIDFLGDPQTWGVRSLTISPLKK